MPLTREFSKIEKTFEKEYGRKKGKSIAYAYANKHSIKTDRS